MNNGDVMFWLLAVNKFQEIKLIVKQMITVLLRLWTEKLNWFSMIFRSLR